MGRGRMGGERMGGEGEDGGQRRKCGSVEGR